MANDKDVKVYKCMNFGACTKADSGELIKIPTIETLGGTPPCPHCHQNTLEEQPSGPGINKKLIAIICGGVAAAGLIGGGIYALSGSGAEPREKATIVLNHSQKTLKVGEKDTLVATISSADANATFIWKASKKSDAVSVADGIVTANSEGGSKVQVKAIVGQDTLKAICAYTVEKAEVVNPGPKPGPGPTPEPKPWASYATFDGTTMTFKKAHIIPGTNQMANPGDKVTGQWKDGEVNMVRWYHDGTSEVLTHK